MALILSGTDNSVSSPAVQGGTGGTSTGIYYPASNQLALATNGTQALLVDSSQNVGIGTSSPTSAAGYGSLSLGGSTGGLLSLKVAGVDTGYVLANSSEFAFKGTTAGPATFYTNNTERMRILAGAPILCLSGGNTSATGTGIAFPATQSASSDANTLDDYEEGTWTATVNSGTGTAQYTKIGRMVYVYGDVTFSGVTSPTALVTGLPFTPAYQTAVSVSYQSVSASPIGLVVVASVTRMDCYNLMQTSVNISNGNRIIFFGGYAI